MNKRTFMASMMLIQAKVMDAAAFADALSRTGGTSVKDGKTIKSKELKANEKLSDALMTDLAKVYDTAGKSLVAFFKANDKEKFNSSSFKDMFPVQRRRRFVSTHESEVMKSEILTLVSEIKSEVEKNTIVASVHHDSGKSWKKNKTDKGRFTSMIKLIDSVAKSVS